ncbi:ATPase family AAA domain-containing protein 1 [Microdochium nivale]|nr:ATPase family AAA domain-containing protein 1 [Microdochium nivale]
MHTRWLRAPRSAARRLPASRHALEHAAAPRRLFSASAIARHSDATGAPEPPITPNGNGSKPDKGDSASEPGESTGEARDHLNEAENLSQDDSKSTSESQGRKKRISPSSLRSRLLRNRSTQEVPPIELPKTFLEHAVTRFEDLSKSAVPAGEEELHQVDLYAATLIIDRLLSRAGNTQQMKLLDFVLDRAQWNDENVERAMAELSEGKTGHVRVRSDLVVAAAYWSFVHGDAMIHAEKFSAELRKAPLPSSALLDFVLFHLRNGGFAPSLKADTVEECIEADFSYRRTVCAIEHVSFEELLLAVRSGLEIKAPPKAKSISGLQRPATLARFDFTSGSTMPRDVVNYVAEKLGADVLYLTPQSLASTLGNYLGQDIARSPSLLTQLGFRAALNSGKVKPRKTEEVEDEDGGLGALPKTFTIVMGQDKKKSGMKASPLAMMDQYLNGSNNHEKNDERWEDLKLNTAIEEIIHAALPVDPKRPLLVHVHDFVALSMDSENGNALVGRLRKILDNLWLDGRKVALVGTCSPLGAPEPYLDALAAAAVTERVVNVVSIPYSSPSYTSIAHDDPRPLDDGIDFWVENMVNLSTVMAALVPEHEEVILKSTAVLRKDPAADLEAAYRRSIPEWTKGVLPLPDIYRAATILIGNCISSEELTSLLHWSKVLGIVSQNDEAVERQTATLKRRIKAYEKEAGSSHGGIFAAMGKIANQQQGGGLDGGDHEKRLLSGLVQAKDIRTTFKDVHAPKETIESIQMLTTLSLIRPEAFSYGVLATDRIPGCLLYGPPGTGKTLLAKAVAKESGANMIEVSGASINNMYVGESEKNVRALFQLAKKKSPAVIFIDEADALLGSRGGGGGGGGGSRGGRRETLNQFLREWDGMEQTKAFIMVATNRPFDLDEAVLRRLPRRLLIDLPTEKDRAAILGIHLKEETLDGAVDLAQLAKQTPLYSGSDLKNVCVAAAMAAVKEEIESGGGLGSQASSSTNSASNGNGSDSDKSSSTSPLSTDGSSGAAAFSSSSSSSDSSSGSGNDSPSSPSPSSSSTPPLARRVLQKRHFEKALKEISASMSDDMASLAAIKKFDEKYGDGMKRKPRKGMGFEITKDAERDKRDVNEGRVRRI